MCAKPLQVDIEPQALAFFHQAVEHHTQGRLQDSIALYQRTLALAPHYFPALSNLGAAWQSLRQFDQAIDIYQQALALTDTHAAIHNNLAVAWREQHDLTQALTHFDRALALDPDYVEALVNRGFVHHLRGHFDLAIADYQRARALDPQFAAATFNLSLTLLTLGDYEQGWACYESRFAADPHAPARTFAAHQPRYDGSQSLAGRTILLWAEQGLGDTLQFCRFALPLLQQAQRVILQVPATLVAVCQSMSPDLLVIAEDQVAPDFDLQCPLMSLPWALSVRLPHIVGSSGYLHADEHQRHIWQQRLRHLQRPRVGLVWSGGFRPGQPEAWETNNRRNLPIHFLGAWRDLPIDFISLQKGEPAQSDWAKARQAGMDLPVIHDFVADLHDFSDTAALISELDLVIAVDTSTAHLSAALGRPTWILHRWDACWRWHIHPQHLVTQTTSAWYDHVVSYHPTVDGDWPSVMSLVKQDLSQWIHNRSFTR